MSRADESRGTDGKACDLDEILKEVAELLPQQAPLHAFVHHNTLHAFEDLPFEEAVVRAGGILGTEPFQSEPAFADHLASGRIQEADLDWALSHAGRDSTRPVFEGGPTTGELYRLRLRHPLEIPTRRAALHWQLAEGGALAGLRTGLSEARRAALRAAGADAAALRTLWGAFAAVCPNRPVAPRGLRWRDRLHAETQVDTDEWVHPLLIRWSAAFLDQGVAYWTMPDREEGLLVAVRRLYGQRLGPPIPWARELTEVFRRQEEEGMEARAVVEWALARLGISPEDRQRFVLETLLSLRGWAGMVRHLEERPDRAPVRAPASRLMDFLALQLCLDLFATRAVLRRERGFDGEPTAYVDPALSDTHAETMDEALIFEAFCFAQLADVPIERFGEAEVARAWIEALRDFGETERRFVYHLAYERRHRVQVLDALAAGAGPVDGESEPPSFQAIFCIDDREESVRRHLEELDPRVETFGYAGFFGVAMQYQGLEDVRPRPLCPVVVSPDRLVREVPREPGVDESDQGRSVARFRLATRVGAQSLVRGGFLSLFFGPLAMLPLVGWALFPRLAHRLEGLLGAAKKERPKTRLLLEAEPDVDVEAALRIGYTAEEMADIVESAVTTMGLDRVWSPLVVVMGHGSSSLNNPHEAAHDCGATGGGRGGPNARAFATMANHPGVRAILATRGLSIPETTRFVGAYHNTCDDDVTWYDLDLLPGSHDGAVATARQRLAEACRREAHERCRRFETAPLDVSVDRALGDVKAHAIDLAQPRPEYGHATNAICIVGRRERTRGLFLDRRAFLVSYDPTTDPEGERLAPLLLSVGPVGAGINLEYYFSYIDPAGYGSGTKLPHNITGLIGVMDGHASDLRPGLPWQMVEIHEPVRLLTIVEAKRSVLEAIVEHQPALSALVGNGWIQLVCLDPTSNALWHFVNGGFEAHRPVRSEVPRFTRSAAYYSGHRGHLPPVWIDRERAA